MRDWLRDNHIRFLLIANVAILVVAALASQGRFLDPYNLQSMARQLPELGLLAMGVMLAMISGNGGIDLSVVSIANLAAVGAGLGAGALFGPEQGVMFTLTFVIIALLIGLMCGLINGLLIARAGFAPILATLGTQLLFTGLAVALSGGPAVRIGYILPFANIGTGSLWRIPISFVIFLLAVVVVAWVLTRTPFGLRLYLMGSNAKAAHYTGISNSRILTFTYVTSALLAAVAGIIFASGASSAKWDYGSSYLLIAILIAVMGGINPDGGYGKMMGLVLSAVALQLLSSGLNLASGSAFFRALNLSDINFLREFLWGLLLLLSLIFTSGQFQFFKLRPRGPTPETKGGTATKS
jgi:simple sugar transport system permease protein